MSGLPWSKWFWSDWRSDPGVRSSSAQARGIWMDCLCIAAQADPTGYVLVNGRTPTTTDLARLTGEPEAVVQSALEELERNGVFSRDRSGRIYNRRMVRDARMTKDGKKWAQKRWSQATETQGENPVPIGAPNGGATENPYAKKPEARSQESRIQKESPQPLTPSPGEGAEPQKRVVLALVNGSKPKKTYAFEGEIIKLNQADFETWRKRFHAIPDLTAELTALDSWFVGLDDKHGANWFHRTSAMLNTRHQKWRAEEKRIGDINESW